MSDTRLSMRIAGTSKFTGREGEDWESWIARFETRFGDEENDSLAGILRDVLDGAALDVCTKLGTKDCKDYKNVKKALQEKFAKTTGPRHAHAELRHVQQAPGESAEHFGGRVLKLTRSANPEATEKQLQAAALEHFMCGLSDLSLQERLHARNDIVSLDVAVMAANIYQEKEAVLASMRATQGHVAAAAASPMAAPVRSETGVQNSDCTEVLSIVDELKQEVIGIKKQLQETTAGARRGSQNRGCFQCGEVSHFKRDCPQLTKPLRQEQSTPRTVPVGRGGNQSQRIGCGRRGHWLADCWRTPSSAGGAGRQRAVRNEPSAKCLGCGRPGHWMAECWRIPASTRDFEQRQWTFNGGDQDRFRTPRQGSQNAVNE